MRPPEPIFVKFMRLQRSTVLLELAANRGNLASVEQVTKEILSLVDEINHLIKIALEPNGKEEKPHNEASANGNPGEQPGNQAVKQKRQRKGKQLGREQVQKVG